MLKNIAERNPFVVSGPIPRDCFCDREKESEYLIRLLTNGNNVVLLSDRRIGKTSLIDFCFSDERICDNYLTALVDIFSARNLGEMTTLLASGVVHAIAPLGKRYVRAFLQTLKSLEGTAEFDPDTGLPVFRLGVSRWKKPDVSLSEIFEFLGSQKKPCLVAIDEFQQVANFADGNAEAFLRSLIQRTGGCNFIFAGSRRHMMREMFLSYSRPFYQSSSMLELQPIPGSAYAIFAERMFDRAGRALEAGAAEWLHKELGGNTFCLQSVMNAAFSLTKKGETCSKVALEAALRAKVLEKFPSYQEILINWLSDRQMMLFLAIANEGEVEHITSAAFVEKHQLGSPSIVQAARMKLLQWDLITESEGRYRVTDKFLEYAVRNSFFDVRTRLTAR